MYDPYMFGLIMPHKSRLDIMIILNRDNTQVRLG